MNLINKMKKRVEQYWDYLRTEDPYNRSILEGHATPEMVSRFLVNVHYLVQHTPIHLKKAVLESNKRGETKLMEFFEHKFFEEQGHDKWAEEDLELIRKKFKNNIDPRIDPTMKNLVRHIDETISKDPYLYLAYIFFAEYLCVIYGPETTLALEQKCGFPSRSLTVVENHAELDKDHVNEWEDIMSDIVDETVYGTKFMKALEETIAIHTEFFLSCGERPLHAAS